MLANIGNTISNSSSVKNDSSNTTTKKRLSSSSRKPKSPRKKRGVKVRVNKVALLDEKLERIISEHSTKTLMESSMKQMTEDGNDKNDISSSMSPNTLQFMKDSETASASIMPVSANVMRELIKEE